jgi:16S rRNA (guanine1207-N2)-methyltransferase
MANFESLINQEIHANPNGLLIVDENLNPQQLQSASGWQTLTNRFDQQQALLDKGWRCSLSDYHWPTDFDTDLVLFRISKEKAVVNHLINLAAEHLKPNARVILLGDKSEGIKSYAKNAQKRLNGDRSETKLGGESWRVELTVGQTSGAPLDDQHYPQLRDITQVGKYLLRSKPGVYGWKKIDSGSQQLVERLPHMLNRELPIGSERVLDLGCGSGYLTLATCSEASIITATDNNAAAIHATQATLADAHFKAKVCLSNAGEELASEYDLILCNPPFHSGFGIDYDLTDRFSKNAARLLAAEGQACFVVNQHVPLKRIASSYFESVELDQDTGNFCTYLLTKPKR